MGRSKSPAKSKAAVAKGGAGVKNKTTGPEKAAGKGGVASKTGAGSKDAGKKGRASKEKAKSSPRKQKKKKAGGKKKKGKKKKKKKKGPRCPIKRRKKPLKRKCYDPTDPRALLNTYYTMHGVVDLLKYRKFKWKKKKK